MIAPRYSSGTSTQSRSKAHIEPVDILEYHRRPGHQNFITFTALRFDKDGDLHGAATGYFEAGSIFGSPTRMEMFDFISRRSRSRICREVTLLPSRPQRVRH